MEGILNTAYLFFYEWLFGVVEPVTALVPYAESITMFIALFTVCFGAYFMFRLVTSLVKLVFYMFEG